MSKQTKCSKRKTVASSSLVRYPPEYEHGLGRAVVQVAESHGIFPSGSTFVLLTPYRDTF